MGWALGSLGYVLPFLTSLFQHHHSVSWTVVPISSPFHTAWPDHSSKGLLVGPCLFSEHHWLPWPLALRALQTTIYLIRHLLPTNPVNMSYLPPSPSPDSWVKLQSVREGELNKTTHCDRTSPVSRDCVPFQEPADWGHWDWLVLSSVKHAQFLNAGREGWGEVRILS